MKGKGSDGLDVRERILTIRLLEKVEAHAAYAKRIGIEVGDSSLAESLPTVSGFTEEMQ